MPQTTPPPSAKIDSGLACLVLVARVFGLPADPAQLQHRFGHGGRSFDTTDLLRAARAIGLKARAVTRTWERLAETSLPAIGLNREGRFFVLVKVSREGVLVQLPEEKRPCRVPAEEFKRAWTGRLVLVTRRASLPDSVRAFNLSWFLPAILKYRKLFAEVLLASLFIQLFALITPLFFQVVIDKVLVHRGLTTLDVLAIGLLGVSLFEVVLSGLRTYLFTHTTNRIDVGLGARLYDHLLALPLAYFQARRVGDSVARVRELEGIRSFLTSSAVTVVIDLLFTVVFLVVMYYYSPRLTLVVLATLPFYLGLSIVVTPLLRARLHEKFNRGADNQAYLVESVSGIETLKAMAVEPHMQRRWEEQLAAYVQAAFRASHLGNVAGQGAALIQKVTVVLILWLGARLVIQGELSVGQLIAFNMLAGRVSGPLLRLVQLWQDFQQAGISIRRLGDILNTPREPGHAPTRANPKAITGRVVLEHVGFRYRADGPETLHDICLDAAPGEILGIVGRSGSGKSTLAKLLLRLYAPDTGRVLVDGVDLALADPAWLRRQVGIVLQESRLFNASVRDNIALSDPGMPSNRVLEAARLAGAHEFILELPEGYDTRVGEQGANLSGGQRQRIAIARALVTDPRVLIFDEATSALDYESERAIQDAMGAICRNRTVFIIAHRLTTLRSAHRLVVLDRGRIVEQGTHADLLNRGGMYARLHAYQNEPVTTLEGQPC